MLVAELSWRRRAAPAEWEQRLFHQVPQRRTHRGGFEPLPLPPGLLAVLRAGPSGTARCCASSPTTAGGRSWPRSSRPPSERSGSTLTTSGTGPLGIPAGERPAGRGAAHRLPGPARAYQPAPGRDFAHGHGWGVADLSAGLVSWSAGVVCLLTTAADGPEDWVQAGQALQQVLLTCATCGVAAALHSQPLELALLRDLIRSRLSDNASPQLVLRLGTVVQTAISVRRPPADVLSADTAGRRALEMNGEPNRRARWQELTRRECFELLAREDLGRIALADLWGPIVLPVNFVLDRYTLVFRTGEGTKLDAASRGHRVAFEADGTRRGDPHRVERRSPRRGR